MRILGIDPGMQITGYACIDIPDNDHTSSPTLVEAGVFRFNTKHPIEQRLVQLFHDLTELITELKPGYLAVEKLYAHYKHPNTAIIMGHARGVILLAATQAEIPIANLPATTIKKSITGNGHASKEQIQHAVQSIFNLPQPPSPPDVADAIAIALTHARRVTPHI